MPGNQWLLVVKDEPAVDLWGKQVQFSVSFRYVRAWLISAKRFSVGFKAARRRLCLGALSQCNGGTYMHNFMCLKDSH
jgi:hypothetical protein